MNQNRNDVSLSRQNYIQSIDVCIDRGKSISPDKNTFIGLVCLTRADVFETNKERENSPIKADIEYAPMHGEEYVDTSIDLFVNDPNADKSDHAELRYNIPYNKSDIVNTPFREYAHALMKKLKEIPLP